MKTVGKSWEVLEKSMNFTQTCLYEPCVFKDCWFEPLTLPTELLCCVLEHDTNYPLLRTGSTQEDPSGHDRIIVDWGVLNQTNSTVYSPTPTHYFHGITGKHIHWKYSVKDPGSNPGGS